MHNQFRLAKDIDFRKKIVLKKLIGEAPFSLEADNGDGTTWLPFIHVQNGRRRSCRLEAWSAGSTKVVIEDKNRIYFQPDGSLIYRTTPISTKKGKVMSSPAWTFYLE